MYKSKYTILSSFIILVLNLVFVGSTYAQVDSKYLPDSALSAYQTKRYDKAIGFYKSIIKTGKESSDLYYNLGNAYYKSQDIAMAILYYEKALKLSPLDEDIRFNLSLAKAQIVDKIDQVPTFFLDRWYQSFVNVFTSNTWSYIAIVTFLFMFIAIFVFIFSSSIKKLAFIGTIVFLLFTVVFNTMAYQKKKNDFDTQYAIIITASIDIKSSPEDGSTSVFILHKGTKLQMLDKIGEWNKIKIEDGNVGWIKDEDIKEI